MFYKEKTREVISGYIFILPLLIYFIIFQSPLIFVFRINASSKGTDNAKGIDIKIYRRVTAKDGQKSGYSNRSKSKLL